MGRWQAAIRRWAEGAWGQGRGRVGAWRARARRLLRPTSTGFDTDNDEEMEMDDVDEEGTGAGIVRPRSRLLPEVAFAATATAAAVAAAATPAVPLRLGGLDGGDVTSLAALSTGTSSSSLPFLAAVPVSPPDDGPARGEGSDSADDETAPADTPYTGGDEGSYGQEAAADDAAPHPSQQPPPLAGTVFACDVPVPLPSSTSTARRRPLRTSHGHAAPRMIATRRRANNTTTVTSQSPPSSSSSSLSL
jgi:hypothetical protein